MGRIDTTYQRGTVQWAACESVNYLRGWVSGRKGRLTTAGLCRNTNCGRQSRHSKDGRELAHAAQSQSPPPY